MNINRNYDGWDLPDRYKYSIEDVVKPTWCSWVNEYLWMKIDFFFARGEAMEFCRGESLMNFIETNRIWDTSVAFGQNNLEQEFSIIW